MTTAQLTFGSALRIGFELLATLVVWLCAFLQFVFVQMLMAALGEACGTGGVIFLMVVWAAWTVSLAVLLVDAVQLYRGRVSRPFAWLRTFSAAVAVIGTPAVLFLG